MILFKTYTAPLALTLSLALGLFGCSSTDTGINNNGGSGGESSGGAGGGSGGALGSGGKDAGPDLAIDKTPDTAPDLAADLAPDLAADVAVDLAPDTSPDLVPDVTPDHAPDTTPDLMPDLMPDTHDMAPACPAGTACTLTDGKKGTCQAGVCAVCADPAGDGACATAYGAGALCLAGSCVTGACRTVAQCTGGKLCNTAHACVACADPADDGACTTAYGANQICVAGACVAGSCHSSAQCTGGKLCDTTHACVACANDAACKADTTYGADHVCFEQKCVKGDCHDKSTDCEAGLICAVKTANTCGACTTDAQCKADDRYKTAATLCKTTAGADKGHCLTNTCNNNGNACAANAGDFCCSNKCVPGNCCGDNDCVALGATFTCVSNTCTQCELAAGNQYFVDPVGGSDRSGTGSGKSAGVANSRCSFRTITRALDFIGANAPAGTTITVVGKAGETTKLYLVKPAGSTEAPEDLPIAIPTNVKITTSGGPILLEVPPVPADVVAFKMVGAGATLASGAGALLTIDGSAHTSGTAVSVDLAAGEASLGAITIRDTGDDSVRVVRGTLQIGPGVHVLQAGTGAKRRSGLEVIAGLAHIAVAANEAQTLFEKNTAFGLSVTAKGELDIDGVAKRDPADYGKGSVVASENVLAGIHLGQDPTFATRKLNALKGVVAFANQGSGLEVLAGTKVQLRDSVLLASGGAGVFIAHFDGTPAGNDTGGIDLGVQNGAGRNVLQAALSAHPNIGAGVCVQLDPMMGLHTVSARGNTFTGALDCTVATPAAKLKVAATCTGGVDLGLRPSDQTTVTVDTLTCLQQP
jgi:hypothetical protein